MRQGQDQELALGEVEEVIQLEVAFALRDSLSVDPALAAGEELAQSAIGGAVARIDQNIRRRIHEGDARSDQQFWRALDLGVFQFLVGAHHAGERVVIGNADGGKTELARLVHIGARIRAAAQEREIGSDADFGIIRDWCAHANNPCTYQWAGSDLPSSLTSSLS